MQNALLENAFEAMPVVELPFLFEHFEGYVLWNKY